MTCDPQPPRLSPKRALLASYDHAYAIAVQKRRDTGMPQFVLRGDNPLQPFRVTSIGPSRHQAILTLVA